MDWERIIQEKRVDQMSVEEKAAIEQEMGLAEFQALQENWEAAQRYFRATEPTITPDPRIRQSVRAHMRSMEEDDLGAKVRRLLSRKVPAYQAVAAALALMAMVHFGGGMLAPSGNAYPTQNGFIADTTMQDTSHRVGYNLYEDSALAKFMIEAL